MFGGGVAEQIQHFFRRPHKKFAFFAVAVRILRGIKSALRMGHFAADVCQRFFHHAAIARFARNLEGVQIEPRQQGIVV